MGIPGGEKSMAGTEEIFEERITKNFPNFMVDTNLEDQETQRKKKTKQKSTSSHFISKLLKTRQKTFRVSRGTNITCR